MKATFTTTAFAKPLPAETETETELERFRAVLVHLRHVALYCQRAEIAPNVGTLDPGFVSELINTVLSE